jgi:hypothetical protein
MSGKSFVCAHHKVSRSKILKEMNIEEEFSLFLERTMPEGFASRPYKTYAEITREFLTTFRFAHTKERVGKKGKVATFDVKFIMKQHMFVMYINEFFKAINVPNIGSWEEIPSDSYEHLREFWRSISVDVPLDIRRDKISHIQHPGLRYFALFLVRGFLARKNTTACTGPIIYLLRCAKDGTHPNFKLGVIISRTLSYAVCHNESKPTYAGAIAAMVYEHIKEERRFRNIGTEVLESNLLDSEMLLKMKILVRVWNIIFGCISSWLGMVLSPALCFLTLNILTGYQTGGLLSKKSMNGSWLLKLLRTMHGRRRSLSLPIRRYCRRYLHLLRRHGTNLHHLHMPHSMHPHLQHRMPGGMHLQRLTTTLGKGLLPSGGMKVLLHSGAARALLQRWIIRLGAEPRLSWLLASPQTCGSMYPSLFLHCILPC